MLRLLSFFKRNGFLHLTLFAGYLQYVAAWVKVSDVYFLFPGNGRTLLYAFARHIVDSGRAAFG